MAHGGDPRQIFRGIDLAEFGLPDELTQMRAGRRIAADLHLHALEAAGAVALRFAGEIGGRFAFLIKAAAGIGLDAVAAGAEEAVYWQFGDLAGDVPQRDVDAADRVHENAAATELPGACEHLLPEMLDQQRILADEQRLEASFDDGRGDTATDPSLADSDDAVIGLDLDEQRGPLRLHPGGAGIGRVATAGQRDCTHIGDFHVSSFGSVRVPTARE